LALAGSPRDLPWPHSLQVDPDVPGPAASPDDLRRSRLAPVCFLYLLYLRGTSQVDGRYTGRRTMSAMR